MKLKFKDDKIHKLEQGVDKSEREKLLEEEIKMLNAELEQEKNHNGPKIVEILSVIKKDSDRLSSINKDSVVISELNDYLQNKAGIDAYNNLDTKYQTQKE